MDVMHVKTHATGLLVCVAIILAVGVNTEGQRKVLGLKVDASEAEPFWTEFLRILNRLGLRGFKLVISDSHESIKAAVSKVLKATWQRCRMHFMRNVLAHAGKAQRRMVSVAIENVFVQETAEAEKNVLVLMTFPRAHWAHMRRRTNIVGTFPNPNEPSITRLVGAMMLGQNGEWSLNRRYMQLEGL